MTSVAPSSSIPCTIKAAHRRRALFQLPVQTPRSPTLPSLCSIAYSITFPHKTTVCTGNLQFTNQEFRCLLFRSICKNVSGLADQVVLSDRVSTCQSAEYVEWYLDIRRATILNEIQGDRTVGS